MATATEASVAAKISRQTKVQNPRSADAAHRARSVSRRWQATSSGWRRDAERLPEPYRGRNDASAAASETACRAMTVEAAPFADRGSPRPRSWRAGARERLRSRKSTSSPIDVESRRSRGSRKPRRLPSATRETGKRPTLDTSVCRQSEISAASALIARSFRRRSSAQTRQADA